MALIQINADMTRTADALERIALALERISPPIVIEEPRTPRRTEASDIGRVDVKGERAALKRLHDLEKQMTE